MSYGREKTMERICRFPTVQKAIYTRVRQDDRREKNKRKRKQMENRRRGISLVDGKRRYTGANEY